MHLFVAAVREAAQQDFSEHGTPQQAVAQEFSLVFRGYIL